MGPEELQTLLQVVHILDLHGTPASPLLQLSSDEELCDLSLGSSEVKLPA